MILLSDFVIELLTHWKLEDLPINILIDDMYYDIEDFYFDEKIHEYIMEIGGGADYEKRADIVIPIKIREQNEMIERFTIDEVGSLVDKDTGMTYDLFEDVVDLLNSINHERIENKRQLNTLKHKIKKMIEV